MTNGEKIREVFPKARTKYHKTTGLADEYLTVFINGCDTCQNYSIEWWNAEYKEPTTKNDLPHCQHTDEEIAKSFIEDVEAVKDQLPTTKNNLGVDCVSRQAVIDAITANCIWENEYNLTSSRIKKAVEKLPSVTPQEPKWIPVSERLPEPYMYVNATCRSLVDDREDWVVETIYLPIPKEANKHGYSDWGNIPILNWGEAEVIAWVERVMPQPYKADRSE